MKSTKEMQTSNAEMVAIPEGITVVGCWAHLRRKFDKAVRSLPKGKAKGSLAAQGLAYCDLLLLRGEQQAAQSCSA